MSRAARRNGSVDPTTRSPRGGTDRPQTPPATPGDGEAHLRRGIRTRIRVPDALRNASGIIGATLILLWVVVALCAPLIAPHDPLAQEFGRLQGPSGENLLGTDTLGRDVLSRMLVASRTTLPAAVLVVAASLSIGAVLGAIAGFFGGIIDEAVMRLADLVFAFPTIILAMIIAAALGPGLSNAVIAILLVSWPAYARVARSLVMSARSSEYVVAGRMLGYGPGRSLIQDIAPNAVAPLLVLATLDIGSAILTMAGLSFLSLGAVPPTPDWGAMISEGVTQFNAWWIALFPGLCILTVVVAFNFLGDSLRDSLDPRTARAVEEQAS